MELRRMRRHLKLAQTANGEDAEEGGEESAGQMLPALRTARLHLHRIKRNHD